MKRGILEIAREAAIKATVDRVSFDMRSVCFAEQLAAISSTAKRRVLKCGRRAGKTTGIIIAMLSHAASDSGAGGRQLYVTLTRSNAKDIAWRDLLDMNDRYALGGEADVTDLTLRLPNGSLIQLRGANNDREISKIRGKHYDRAIIDEAQSIPDRILRPLISDVISPALMDRSGELWLVGTPSYVRAGRFYECYAGRDKALWEQHGWTVKENTRLPAVMGGKHIDDVLKSIRDENGWLESDPAYRREILGEDVDDSSSLLFAQPEHGLPFEPPAGKWYHVLGIDVGHDDASAFAVLGWIEGSRELWLIHERTEQGLDVTGLADITSDIIDNYSPVACVIDQGGLGKMIAEELRRRYALPLEPAKKSDKPAHIALLNTAIKRGTLRFPDDGIFADDIKRVQRDPKRAITGELAELQGGFHSDIADAVLYAYRRCNNWAEEQTLSKTIDDIADDVHRQEASLVPVDVDMDDWITVV